MNCTGTHAKLDDYVDGALSSVESRALETHLARCSNCRESLASLRALRAATAALPRELAPDRELWPEIARDISGHHHANTSAMPGFPVDGVRRAPLPNAPRRRRPAAAFASAPPGRRPAARATRSRLVLAAAAVILIAALGWRLWMEAPAPRPGWAVSPLSGSPHIGAAPIAGTAHLRPGDWLETDGTSRARLEVGSIGEVRLEPNSRVRLVGAASTQHRLELTRGTLHALIWSPPRLFFVDTPSATAIDLGCVYTLAVDAEGDGILHVTAGYVALEHGPRTVVIPAGMMCAARRGAGPGTPFAADAPATLRDALERFDFEPAGGAAALDQILREARREDAVTLWHLLSRAPVARRGDVFDNLAALQPPPEGVTRDGILRADAAMLARWAGDLGLVAASGVPYRNP